MSITFTKSANGEATCSYNSIRLHSAYNPSREAERFVQNVNCDFNPKYILLTGAALSYCAGYFKKYFPSAILCAIQFSEDFKPAEKLWNKTFYTTQNEIPLSEQIYSYMGEEGVVSCFFTAWQPSEKAFPKENEYAWKQIKNAVIKSRNVLATRSFFAKRWVRNAMRFCMFLKRTCILKKGSSPIVICASGPSLKTSLPYLSKYRDRFFLIAVSSALYPLVNNSIIPDLCISTDGGYWAKHHLSHALVNNYDIPIALSPESACYAQIMHEHKIMPLSYGDGISETFMHDFKIPSMPAYRNGTVSGTAAQFALSVTDGNIFFCGLDLAPANGYPHTQPNELEVFNKTSDNRIKNLETRIYPSSRPSSALNIYKSWFSSSNFDKRLFRLSDNFRFNNSLGKIQDVDWNFFEMNTHDASKLKPEFYSSENNIGYKESYTKIKYIVESNIHNKNWIREAVPADYIVYERCAGMDSESEAAKKVHSDMQTFYKDIMRTFSKERQS
ncbi:MAG: DUF115 domain-containing protein [Treponema sp.]|nr:DUF115 domain-containing protein [Treponema sp.]